MLDSNLPLIGILDSGVGGLSVLREIRRRLPAAPIHYFGDSAWCPYGNKEPRAICDRVAAISDYLLEHGAGLLVIACNSATIHGVGSLRMTFPLPVVGMEPGVKPAAERTRRGVVGVLATEASIAGEKFHQLVSTHAHGVKVVTRPCPRFVELVERGELSGAEAENAVDEAVSPLLEAGADTIVLGCTHYPFLLPVIRARLPENVDVIDTGPAVARRVEGLIGSDAPAAASAPAIDATPFTRIETSGRLETLERLLPILLPGLEAETGEARLRDAEL